MLTALAKNGNPVYEMIKVKDYNAGLVWLLTDQCNLQCEYCYEIHNKKDNKNKAIDITSALRTLQDSKKRFRITLCGGEPFLISNFIPLCDALTENNYIDITTNLVCDNVKKFTDKINPQRVLFIVASLHISQLEKHNLMGKYIDHFLYCKKKGFGIYAWAVAHPSLKSSANKYINLFKKKKISVTFTPFIGIFNGKEYPMSYTQEEIDIFNLDRSRINLLYSYNHVCSAGKNMAIIFPDGRIKSCMPFSSTIGNIFQYIEFQKTSSVCPCKICPDPFYEHDPHLFKISLGK
jgi:MoaA/NifB/PqqE/SkfB family radical SAM enzyme